MSNYDFHTYIEKYVTPEEKDKYNNIIKLKERFKHGDLSYWSSLDSYITENELNKLLNISRFIEQNADLLVVIGIGGSYMGAKAVIEALTPIYKKQKPEILFLGTNLCADEYNELFQYIKDKRIVVNVISKSGTTLETNIAFDLIKKQLELKYDDDELKKRIVITTDRDKGLLREKVNSEGYLSLDIPFNIGGRFSVFTAAGLLPISVSGINVKKILDGCKNGFKLLDVAMEYAIIRNILYKKNKIVESFTVYNSKLYYFTEWLKQLFAETQGKKGKAILPTSCVNTRDLHSLGQYLQEGKDIIFETVIGIENTKEIYVEKYNMYLHELNNIAMYQVAKAHYNGNTPSNIIMINELNEEEIGSLMQFFIYASIIGALLLDVNPFDQPGVQEYKKLINKELGE